MRYRLETDSASLYSRTRTRGTRQLRDEAYHKMTLMKAEYTGRVKRRDDKIAELEVALRLFCVCPAGPLRKHARFDDAPQQDKENDTSLAMSQNDANIEKQNKGRATKTGATKSAEVERGEEEEEVSGKRRTRSSAKVLAPR